MILFDNVGDQLMDEAPFDRAANAQLNILFGELEGIARMPIRPAPPDVPPPVGVQCLPFSIPRDLPSPTMVASVGFHKQAMQRFSDHHNFPLQVLNDACDDARFSFANLRQKLHTTRRYPSKLKELSTYFGINKQNTINHVDSTPQILTSRYKEFHYPSLPKRR